VSTQLRPTQSTETEQPTKQILKSARGFYSLATGDGQHHDGEHTGTGNRSAVGLAVQLRVAVAMLGFCYDFRRLLYH